MDGSRVLDAETLDRIESVAEWHSSSERLVIIVIAIAEIVGCYLPYLWLKGRVSALALIPAALSLAAFAWLLSLHPGAVGSTYGAHGGVYVSVALVWLWQIDRQKSDGWDLVGVAITLIGTSIMAFAPRPK